MKLYLLALGASTTKGVTPSRQGSPMGTLIFILSILGVLIHPVSSQILTPSSIEINESSPVCNLDSTVEQVCLQLPADATTSKVDIFFLSDDTGSFVEYSKTMQNLFASFAAELGEIAPSIEFGFGVGRFQDYGGPGKSFSGCGKECRPFILNQPIVTTIDAGGAFELQLLISNAFGRQRLGLGGDGPESALAEGLYQVATGIGFDGNGDGKTTGLNGTQVAGSLDAQVFADVTGDVPAFSTLDTSSVSSGTVGGAGFRRDALKIVILATDFCSIAAFDSNKPLPTVIPGTFTTETVTSYSCQSSVGKRRFGFVSDSYSKSSNTLENAVVPKGAGTVTDTIHALTMTGIRVVGLSPDTSISFLAALARTTGAVDSDGKPLVSSISGGEGVVKAALLGSVIEIVKKPVDIMLRRVGSVENVTVTTMDELRLQVFPGEQACFDVQIQGQSDKGISGSSIFRLLDANTRLELSHLTLHVECPDSSTPKKVACENKITGFTLIDAVRDVVIGPLPTTVNYENLPTPHLNVRVDYESCSGKAIDSILVEFEGRSFCERHAPYAVFRDINSGNFDVDDADADYRPFTFPVGGPYIIKAIPFDSSNCIEGAGAPFHQELIVTNGCETSEIMGYTLVDAGNSFSEISPLASLVDSSILEAASNVTFRVTFKSCLETSPIGSILVEFENTAKCANASNLVAPYMHVPVLGELEMLPRSQPYTLKATPFTSDNCDGAQGTSLEQTFEVVDWDACPGEVTGFHLYNAKNDTFIRELSNGDDFCQPSYEYNIEAMVSQCYDGSVRSVRFVLVTSGFTGYGKENHSPFFLFGNDPRTDPVYGSSLEIGMYQLTATPHARFNGRGDDGVGHTIEFEILDCKG